MPSSSLQVFGLRLSIFPCCGPGEEEVWEDRLERALRFQRVGFPGNRHLASSGVGGHDPL